MGGLIDRQAAIDALGYCQTYLFDSRDKDKKISLEDAEYAIEQLPSAQPEPQEGHWIEGKIYRNVIECYCSECGQIMTTAATVRMNYCPNCGSYNGGGRK